MKRKIYTFISCLSCIVFLGSTIVLAKEELSVTNHIETGVVDIELNEYQKSDDGTLVPWENGIIVLPGTTVSKIPRISNEGYDCYVRAKLEFSIDDLENSYYDIGENWIEAQDGYWYYTEVLESGEYTDLFQGIQIPTDFSQEYEEQELSLKIDVDAIQTKNFIPDYESDKPWGDVIIQNAIHEGPYNIQSLEVQTPKSFEVQYDKESGKLIKNEDDFFKNIPTLFPGDIYTDELELTNTSDNPIKLYFNTYSEDSDLLNKIRLTIVLDDGEKEELIYEGSLNSKELEEKFLLTTIQGNSGQNLIYSIEVPSELDNQYTLLKDSVRWMFSVEKVDQSSNQSTTHPVKTGDYANTTLLLVIMIVSGLLSVILICKKERLLHEK